MLKRIHIGHMKNKKNWAKEIIFWPSMKIQIEDSVSNCSACTDYQRANPREPVNTHKLLDRSLQNVADLFELGNEHYLIVVVYYSTYFKLGRMPTTTSTTFPEKVVPDKGPQPPFEYNLAYVVVGI